MDIQKIEHLKNSITGIVAVSGDDAYNKASAMFEYTATPGLVVRPESHKDIATILEFAKEHALPFIIRSGGHGNLESGAVNDMIIIDMSHFNTIEVLDKNEGLVRIGAGALWHEVAAELHQYALALSSGDTRTVGVGGLATGGGIGWMVRKYGPLVDSIVGAEITTAGGRTLVVSEHENADLFWAIRGGGGNFGIVTHFTFKAQHLQNVVTATIKYPLENVAHVLQEWRNAMRRAPKELLTNMVIFPSFKGGAASIMIQGCFAGDDKQAADEAYAPFLRLGEVTFQTIEVKPYMDILEDAKRPSNIKAIVQNAFLKEFSDDVIAVIAKLCDSGKPPFLQIGYVGGVMNTKAPDATAFSNRDSEVLIVNPSVVTPPHTNKEEALAMAMWKENIEPFGQGVYLNLLNTHTGKELEQAFPPATLERLRKIKAVYDPENIFKSSHNITPWR